MNQSSLARAGVSIVIVGTATLVPVVGTFIFGPILALALGGLLGDAAARQADGSILGSALLASAQVGFGALVGTLLGAAGLLLILGLGVWPDDGARVSESAAVSGLLLGSANFLLSVIGGLAAGIVESLGGGAASGEAA